MLAAILRPYPKGSGSASTPYQRDSVVEALSRMQRDALVDDTRINAAAIKTALKLALYNAGSSNASQIVDNEQKVIEFVSRIFQMIFDDSLLSEPVKSLLSKLQVSVIKLALIDFEFLQNAAHPARRLLNGLVDLSAGIANKNEPLFGKLAGIVRGVIDTFETDLAPLEKAFQQLLQLREVEAEEIRKVEGRFQREARIEARRLAAKRKVVGTLNRYMQNVQLPEDVMAFILKCWAPYMAQTYLRQGIQSQAWHDAVGILRQIVKGARVAGNTLGARQFGIPVDVYFQRLQTTLAQAGCYKEAQVAIMRGTRDWFAQRYAAEASAPDAETKLAADSPSADPTAEEEPEVGQTQTRLKLLLSRMPAEVKPGAWFEIYRGEGKAKRRLKLLVVLEDIGRLLFADRTGRGVLEVELEGFIEDLNAGRTILINDDNRFDQALSQVINSIRANQARQDLVIKG